ncbi:MAG: hypothetical protein JNJ59_14950 [Deltaproteobacteria bacterium]|nr:hypothetical protein [Deltaproteobacteria bacterium]
MKTLSPTYSKTAPGTNPFADRARARRAALAALADPTCPKVDPFAHVDDDVGHFGADQRASTWMRAEGGAA